MKFRILGSLFVLIILIGLVMLGSCNNTNDDEGAVVEEVQ